jgi:TRAP-type uncharacterized transport system fused permease subunit
LRRTTGTGLFYTTLFFFGLALVAGMLPGEFAAKSIPLPRLTYYSVWDSTAALGVTLKIVSGVVVIFVLFGQVLFKRSRSSAPRCSAPFPATSYRTSSRWASSPFR